MLGTRRSGRTAGIGICPFTQARGPRCNPFRVGRLNDSAIAPSTGGAFAILPELESRPGRVDSAVEGTKLYELRTHTFQSERNNALRTRSCRQAEFFHFREVRFRWSLGTRTSHQTTYPICG